MPKLQKTLTGIAGFDEITFGGLPKNRITLVAGGAGCGKTLFGVEFLVRGATLCNEPGVLVTFEESANEIIENTESLGFNVNHLIKQKKIFIDYIHLAPSELQESGEYNLEGLFIRLKNAIKTINAKRIVLDTTEVLFNNLPNKTLLRSELTRLFHWLKSKKVTVVVTGEKGSDTFTRYGLEEYIADCVIFLDQRIMEQISTRRLRIIKYRGSLHGTNEYPFTITSSGIFVLPITSLGLDYPVDNQRISSGIPDVDEMLEGGKGLYKGSSILISGTAGTGKTSFATSFIDFACRNNQRCIYFAFEEPAAQIIRNTKSIGLNLDNWVKKDRLQILASRPTSQGLETHLLNMYDVVSKYKPDLVVIDPITNLKIISNFIDVRSALSRFVDFLKMNKITGFFTCLIEGANLKSTNESEMGISSLMDTWMTLEYLEKDSEQIKTLRILKSRGMEHSNKVRNIIITSQGIHLKPL